VRTDRELAGLWEARARQQAARADRLERTLFAIAELANEAETTPLEAETPDDRHDCAFCQRSGWPEDGFRRDDEEGFSVCPDCQHGDGGEG
jgi:hypothetical protein